MIHQGLLQHRRAFQNKLAMRFRILPLAALGLICQGCQRPQNPARFPPLAVRADNEQQDANMASANLDSVLDNLFSRDENTREAASKRLFELSRRTNLASDQGLKVLRMAATKYPFEKPDPENVTSDLVALASNDPKPEYAAEVVKLFGRFSDRAKPLALVLLARMEDKEAAQAYMQIVRSHARAGDIPHLIMGPLEQKPRHENVFFPELLDYADVDKLSNDIYRFCLAYANAGLVSPKTLAPFAKQVLARYELLAANLRPAQRAEGIAWMWEDAYSEARFSAGLIMDLLGHFPSQLVEDTLRRALEFRDTRLKYFAVASLFRLGKEVERKEIAAIAANPEMRNWLFELLQKHGKSKGFPDQFRTQAAFAEADMVNWLTYPTELGRTPDQIELMKVVPVDTGLPNGIYDYYLFRFKTLEPHWAAKDGWIAGISGPFRRGDAPTILGLGDTFSTFDKWESKTPDEHVGNIRELMQRWGEHHAKTMAKKE